MNPASATKVDVVHKSAHKCREKPADVGSLTLLCDEKDTAWESQAQVHKFDINHNKNVAESHQNGAILVAFLLTALKPPQR